MIWPPWKPISMRTRSATSNELREDAVHGAGVDERDLHPEQARPRGAVDQLGTLAFQPGEPTRQVVDLVGDVVHPGAAAGQEAADRRVRAERAQELDVRGADAERRRLHALLVLALPPLELGTEQAPVRGDRLVQVLDGETDVVDALRGHRPRCYPQV